MADHLFDKTLLRLVDDYLLITTDQTKAKHFHDVMYKGEPGVPVLCASSKLVSGHPEYGCFIGRDKTLANFPYPEIMNVIDPSQRGMCQYVYGLLVSNSV